MVKLTIGMYIYNPHTYNLSRNRDLQCTVLDNTRTTLPTLGGRHMPRTPLLTHSNTLFLTCLWTDSEPTVNTQ
jgi:hypothetical protein